MKYEIKYNLENIEFIDAQDLKIAERVAQEIVMRRKGVLLSIIPFDPKEKLHAVHRAEDPSAI